MIDLHTHSIFSDGELIPFELARRAEEKGYKVIAITDHMDFSNMDFIIPRIVKAAKTLNKKGGMMVISGCELTHIPPELFKEAVKEARKLGAGIIVGHGESPVEPVLKGTNRAAIEAGVDILAHPGFITTADAKFAAKKGVFLEITARAGHNMTNGHVVKTARLAGASMVINTDAHAPKDLFNPNLARKVGIGAGLSEEEFSTISNKVSAWIKSRF